MITGWRTATLLRHRGHGPTHFDLVINAGLRCPTLQLSAAGPRWLLPHRRRYLTFAGPIPGKGRVDRCWRGRVWYVPSQPPVLLIDDIGADEAVPLRRLRLVRHAASTMLRHPFR